MSETGLRASVLFGFLLALVLVVAPVAPASCGGGECGAGLLDVGAGACALGMGGAHTGARSGVDMVFWNPAGMAGMSGFQLFAGHTESSGGADFEHAAAGFRVDDSWVIAIAGIYGKVGGDGGAGASESEAFAVIGAGCVDLLGWGSAGVGVKYINENRGGESAGAFALDAGVSGRLPLTGLSVGAAVRNWGTDLELGGDTSSLPTAAVLGAYFRPPVLPLSASADIAFPDEGESFLAVGLEYTPLPLVAVRGGWSTRDGGPDYTLGVGLGVPLVAVDYAYISYGESGSGHSASARFGL